MAGCNCTDRVWPDLGFSGRNMYSCTHAGRLIDKVEDEPLSEIPSREVREHFQENMVEALDARLRRLSCLRMHMSGAF